MRAVGRHLRDPLLLAWLALCAVTLVSLTIGGSAGAAAGAAVLGIAFAKAAVVMAVFMDLRTAPPALKVLAASWLAAVLGALLAIHTGWLG